MGISKTCIFSPLEAKAIAAGDALAVSLLQQWVCPSLTQGDVEQTKRQFASATVANPHVVALQWNGNVVDVLNSEKMKQIRCEETQNPLRCKTVMALFQGRLSNVTTEHEVDTKTENCDWKSREILDDQAWMKFYHENQFIADNLSIHPDTIMPSSHCSPADARLLGAMMLLSNFLEGSGLWFKSDASMLDMLCVNNADCNIISTRALDHLWQSGVPNADRIEMVRMPGHATLRVTLENGSFVYFNNGNGFLPAGYYSDKAIQVATAWQLVGENLFDVGVQLLNYGDTDAGMMSLHKVLAIDPFHVEAHLVLADALEHHGDFFGAISEKMTAIMINAAYVYATLRYEEPPAVMTKFKAMEIADPITAKDHLQSCVHYGFSEKPDSTRAITECRASLAKDPNNSWTHYYLGSLYSNIENWDAAMAQLRMVSSPDAPSVHADLAIIWYYGYGNADAAVLELQKAMTSEMEADYFTLEYWGDILHDSGDITGAIAKYREALADNPEMMSASLSLSQGLAAQGDRAGAIVTLRMALKQAWVDPKYRSAARTFLKTLLHPKTQQKRLK